jgi:hypothetical protein
MDYIKNFYGFILLEGKYVSKEDGKFKSLVKKVLSMYGKVQDRDKNDLIDKLFTYYDDDLYKNQQDYPFDPLSKKQFPRIVDMIHYLDSMIGKMASKRGFKKLEETKFGDIPLVFDRDGIKVYRADSAHQAIKLGRGTTFCISADSGTNRFYDYAFDTDHQPIKQKYTTYFIFVENSDDPIYSINVVHYSLTRCEFTNMENKTKKFGSFDIMYDTLSYYSSVFSEIFNNIPKKIFKMVELDPSIIKKELERFGKEYISISIKYNPLLAVKLDYRTLQYIEYQTEEMCELAVQKSGIMLRYVKNKTERICKLAVNNDPWAFIYVDFQTEEICKLAVNLDGRLLKYVKMQTEEICEMAVKQNPSSLEYVKDLDLRDELSFYIEKS